MANLVFSEEREIQFECPYCEGEIARAWERDTTWISCEHCGEAMNVDSQRAMVRANDTFHFARELTTRELVQARNRPNRLSPRSKDALLAYQRAYTSVQVALGAEVPLAQQRRAVEIMAETTRILQRNNMVSVLEAKYWTQWMVCHTAWAELETLQAKLSQPHPRVLTRVLRFPHWHLRRGQLRRALARREERLQELESTLAFIDEVHLKRDFLSGSH